MKSYDDLQRFKEKVPTENIDFKDMSDQLFNANRADWPVIRQLRNAGSESVLENSPRINAPQAVEPAAFSRLPGSEKPAMPFRKPPCSVTATGASVNTGASLLDTIASSWSPAETSSEAVPAGDQTGQIASGHRQLFRTPTAPAPGAVAKQTLLFPLLEKIASCR